MSKIVFAYLHLLVPPDRIAARSQLRPSARVICFGIFGSAIKNNSSEFFQNSPAKKKGCAGARTIESLRRRVVPSGRLALPNALQSRLFVFAPFGVVRIERLLHRSILSPFHEVRVCGHRLLAVGSAKRSHPASSHPCFTRGGIACLRSRSRRHTAGHRAVRCWLRQTLTVPAPSSVPSKTFEHSQFRCRRYSERN